MWEMKTFLWMHLVLDANWTSHGKGGGPDKGLRSEWQNLPQGQCGRDLWLGKAVPAVGRETAWRRM